MYHLFKTVKPTPKLPTAAGMDLHPEGPVSKMPCVLWQKPAPGASIPARTAISNLRLHRNANNFAIVAVSCSGSTKRDAGGVIGVEKYPRAQELLMPLIAPGPGGFYEFGSFRLSP
jgi:hypothetical protein